MQDGPFAEDMHHCNYTSTNQLAATVNADTPWACPCQTNMQAQLHEGDWAAAGIPFVQGTNALVRTIQDLAGRSASATSTVVVADRAYAYDANGNMTTNGVFTYVWDCENRLTEVWKNGALVQSNRYDALCRRREKIEYFSDGSAVTNRYIYKDWLVLAITDGTGALLETYTHGTDLSGGVGGKAEGVGGLLSYTILETNACFYAYDCNVNLQTITSSEQYIIETYDFEPFGAHCCQSGRTASRFQFCGKEHDSLVALYYYGYRYYSGIASKCPSRDPSGERDSCNLYGLLLNSPVNNVDFLGLATFNGKSGEEGFFYDFSVEDCEIGIFYGHGSAAQPHKFNFESEKCSKGVFFGCHEYFTNEKIPEEHRLLKDDWGFAGPRDHHRILDSAMSAREDAIEAAKAMCQECKCGSVSIQYVFVPHNTRAERVRDRFFNFGGLDQAFVGADGTPWPGNETIPCNTSP